MRHEALKKIVTKNIEESIKRLQKIETLLAVLKKMPSDSTTGSKVDQYCSQKQLPWPRNASTPTSAIRTACSETPSKSSLVKIHSPYPKNTT